MQPPAKIYIPATYEWHGCKTPWKLLSIYCKHSLNMLEYSINVRVSALMLLCHAQKCAPPGYQTCCVGKGEDV